MRSYLVVISGLVVVCAPRASSGQVTVARVAGCYRIAPAVLRVQSTVLALDTVRLRLDSASVVGPFGGAPFHRLKPDTLAGIYGGSAPPDGPGWQLARDSIRVIWTTGFTFVVASAQVRGDSLIGVITYGTDAVVNRPDPTAKFVAVRVTCPR